MLTYKKTTSKKVRILYIYGLKMKQNMQTQASRTTRYLHSYIIYEKQRAKSHICAHQRRAQFAVGEREFTCLRQYLLGH